MALSSVKSMMLIRINHHGGHNGGGMIGAVTGEGSSVRVPTTDLILVRLHFDQSKPRRISHGRIDNP